MKIDILLRAAQILRAQPAFTMPLGELYRLVTAELGSQAGSYADFCASLKNRPASFVVIDPPRPLDSTAAWPRHIRERYDSALADTGLAMFARVALAELPGGPCADDALAIASRTINGLWQSSDADPILQAALARACYQLDELNAQLDAAAERPTTRPPYPRP
jgi:hypothetical protein